MTISPLRARATAPPGMSHFDIKGGMTLAKLSAGVTPFGPSSGPPPPDWQAGPRASTRPKTTTRRVDADEKRCVMKNSGRVLKHRAGAFSTLFHRDEGKTNTKS